MKRRKPGSSAGAYDIDTCRPKSTHTQQRHVGPPHPAETHTARAYAGDRDQNSARDRRGDERTIAMSDSSRRYLSPPNDSRTGWVQRPIPAATRSSAQRGARRCRETHADGGSAARRESSQVLRRATTTTKNPPSSASRRPAIATVRRCRHFFVCHLEALRAEDAAVEAKGDLAREPHVVVAGVARPRHDRAGRARVLAVVDRLEGNHGETRRVVDRARRRRGARGGVRATGRQRVRHETFQQSGEGLGPKRDAQSVTTEPSTPSAPRVKPDECPLRVPHRAASRARAPVCRTSIACSCSASAAGAAAATESCSADDCSAS